MFSRNKGVLISKNRKKTETIIAYTGGLLIRISNDVVIKKPGYILKADILEIDLITKNTKLQL